MITYLGFLLIDESPRVWDYLTNNEGIIMRLEFYNGYEWVLDRMIDWDTYVRIVKLSGNGEGKEWRVTLWIKNTKTLYNY